MSYYVGRLDTGSLSLMTIDLNKSFGFKPFPLKWGPIWQFGQFAILPFALNLRMLTQIGFRGRIFFLEESIIKNIIIAFAMLDKNLSFSRECLKRIFVATLEALQIIED